MDGNSVQGMSVDAAQRSIHLTVLPYKLRLARLPRTCRPTDHILSLMFFPHSPNRFYSFSATPHEYSIVLEESAVPSLPPQATVADGQWRVIQVCEGELGFADLGVVQLVTAPLALERISVFYISTFNTDFVLVRDADLGRTLACLRREFLAQVEGDDAADASEATAPAPTPTAPLPVLTQQRESGGVALSPLEQEGPRTQLAPMNIMPVALHIARMPKDSVPMHTHMLLRLYCSPRAEDDAMPGVLSFTETEDEVSLVFPHMEWVLDYMAGYADLIVSPHTWIPLQIAETLDLIEPGIVSAHSLPLTAAGLPMFYLSTFLTDINLVRAEDREPALTALRHRTTVVEDRVVLLSLQESKAHAEAAATTPDTDAPRTQAAADAEAAADAQAAAAASERADAKTRTEM